MALNELTENVEIVQTLGTYPNQEDGLTPDELKKKFDEGARIIKKYLNEQIVPVVRNAEEYAGAMIVEVDEEESTTGAIFADDICSYARNGGDVYLHLNSRYLALVGTTDTKAVFLDAINDGSIRLHFVEANYWYWEDIEYQRLAMLDDNSDGSDTTWSAKKILEMITNAGAVTSQGRSAKYYVTSPGWKRVLNIIRGTAGTLSAGLAKSRAAGGYSCQTMAVNLSGYVYFPGKELPKKQPVLYQLFNNEFGENDSDDAGRRARITQVRIGYPADGTDYPDSDGAINYATNPVNCYVDIYVDFVPQFDGDRCQLNLNFAGFADSHNCEPITEETDASDTGIYGEKLEYHTLQLKKDAELYLPDGSVEAKEIRAENMPFFKLEGTAEHPVILKSLADGVYYISGMGNYSGKETVKTLNTGVYMVRQFTSYASVLFLQITAVHRLRWYKITASGYEEKLIELDDIAVHGERIAALDAALGDIEAALDGIIAIQEELIGSSALITFYVIGLKYTAEEGMTWGEWTDSKYNTNEFWHDGSYMTDFNGAIFYDSDGNMVTPDMVIIADAHYEY